VKGVRTSTILHQSLKSTVWRHLNLFQVSSIYSKTGDQSSNEGAAVVTIEKAASAKVFFECYYNGLHSGQLTPRSLRRRQLEGALYQDSTLSQKEKDERRREWAKDETDHLRETRVMKARSGNIMKGKDSLASKYEVVKVLGKGSFGVVRLVKEKSEIQ
jgi:protein-serine/threonine kinase